MAGDAGGGFFQNEESCGKSAGDSYFVPGFRSGDYDSGTARYCILNGNRHQWGKAPLFLDRKSDRAKRNGSDICSGRSRNGRKQI